MTDASLPAVAISAQTPDWSRERKSTWRWAPSRSLLASVRAYQRHAASRSPLAALGRMAAVLRHRWWSIVTGADIPLNCRLGGGLLLPHPNGIVIHPQAEVGPNCLIFQQVTLGVGGRPGTPRIGANAVVLDDVPSGATAVGIPARVVAP